MTDYGQLSTCVNKLFHEPKLREEMGARGRQVVENNRGSLENHLRILQKLINVDQAK